MKQLLLSGLLAGLLATPAFAQPTVSLLAGGQPFVDGPAGTGRYQQATGLYLDAAGNLLFTDLYQVRQVSPAGVLSTVAGLPRSGGTATSPAGTLGLIGDITGDAAGNLYVSSVSTIRRITPAGQISQVVGAPLSNVTSFVRSTTGDFYTTEDYGSWVLRKVTAGGTASVLAGKGVAGYKDGLPGVGRIGNPSSLLLHTDGNFYFSDGPLIRQYNPATGYLRTIAGDSTTTAFADGQGQQAHFGYRCELASAPGGNLYVADATNSCLRLVTPAGAVTTLAGSATAPGYADGTGSAARFENPSALATLPNGDVLVTEYGVNRIRRVTPAGVVSTYLAAAGTTQVADGPGSQARFRTPAYLSAGAGGNLLLLEANYLNGDESGNFFAGGRLRQVSATGTTTTLFTLNAQSGYQDGPIATAKFGFETPGAVQDAAGNVYVADLSNHCIRKITPAGVVSTLAGDPANPGYYQDGTGSQARMVAPFGLTIDGAGNLYTYDIAWLNIRKITPAGVVTTVAGYMGGATHNTVPLVDGQGATARLGLVWGMTAAPDGTLFIVSGNTVRRVSPTGLVSTIAGDLANNTTGQVDGQGTAARFNFYYGATPITRTPDGVLFVSELNNDFNSLVEARTRIRRISPTGAVTTVLASNESGYADGPATTALLGSARGLAYTAAGTLVVADSRNHCLRQLSGAALLTAQPAATLAGTLRAYPNPTAGGTFAAELPAGAVGQAATLTLVDALGRIAWQHAYAAVSAAVTVPTAGLPAGLYRLRCTGVAGISSCAVQVQ